MRIWEKIKINDIVIYKDEKYVVKNIYKESATTYGILKNIATGKERDVPLYACKYEEN